MWNKSPCLIFGIIFKEKCFSCCILLIDQISLPGCLYFMRYWAICLLQLFVNQVVTSWILKLTYLSNWAVIHFSNEFLKDFQLLKIKSDLRLRLQFNKTQFFPASIVRTVPYVKACTDLFQQWLENDFQYLEIRDNEMMRMRDLSATLPDKNFWILRICNKKSQEALASFWCLYC